MSDVFATPFLSRVWNDLSSGPDKVQAFILFAILEGYLSNSEYDSAEFLNDLELMLSNNGLSGVEPEILIGVAGLQSGRNCQ